MGTYDPMMTAYLGGGMSGVAVVCERCGWEGVVPFSRRCTAGADRFAPCGGHLRPVLGDEEQRIRKAVQG